MARLQSFIVLTLVGGLLVVLPTAIFILLLQWLFMTVTDFIQPLTDLLTERTQLQELLADLAVLGMILIGCFSIGLLVKTRVGNWLHAWVDTGLARFAPGYTTIRDLIVQFLGGGEQASLLNGQVALVALYPNSDLRVTAIVTAEWPGGYTVFVPTAPVPTSGMVYHLNADSVTLRPDLGVDQAMKTVIACGAGSQQLITPAGQTETAPAH